MANIDKCSNILITGGDGLVGTALFNYLNRQGFQSVFKLTRQDCDLRDQTQTVRIFKELKPKYIFHLAAKVYGIMGNMQNQGLVFLENSHINLNVVEAAYLTKVEKIVAMGTCAGYPAFTPDSPLKESEFLKDEPHDSEYGYAQSKRNMLTHLMTYHKGYQLRFSYVISTNLYGLNDKFDIEHGHVIPSLIRKFYEAKYTEKPLVVWGSGSSKRDFLFAEDAAEALLYILHYIDGPVNMASGKSFSIKEVVDILGRELKMQDQVTWDSTKPDGRDFRALDISKLSAVGFTAKTSLEEGLKRTFDWFVTNASVAKK